MSPDWFEPAAEPAANFGRRRRRSFSISPDIVPALEENEGLVGSEVTFVGGDASVSLELDDCEQGFEKRRL